MITRDQEMKVCTHNALWIHPSLPLSLYIYIYDRPPAAAMSQSPAASVRGV